MKSLACLAFTSGIAAVLAGCATAEPVPLPNGRQGYVIDGCDSVAECYKKASETCGGGKYSLISQGGETVPIVSGANGVVTTIPVEQHHMTIECEAPGH